MGKRGDNNPSARVGSRNLSASCDCDCQNDGGIRSFLCSVTDCQNNRGITLSVVRMLDANFGDHSQQQKGLVLDVCSVFTNATSV